MKALLFPHQILVNLANGLDWFERPHQRYFKQVATRTNGEFLQSPDIVDAFHRERRAVILYKRIERGRYKVIEQLKFSIWLRQTPALAFALYRWPTKELEPHASLPVRFHAAYNCYGKPTEPVEEFFANPACQEQLVALPAVGPMRIILDGKELTLHKYYERGDTVESALTYLNCLSDLAGALEEDDKTR
ncbi:MAG: hypothetical protein R2911_36030 [Caldilineaceae bacterium]